MTAPAGAGAGAGAGHRDGAAVVLEGVSVSFGSVTPLREVSLRVGEGELVGIVGPSGAGKTTLLRLLLGEVRPATGTLHLGGPDRGRPSIGYVPQIEGSERTFPLTVEGAVLLGGAAGSSRLPWFSRSERAAARSTLDRLGIADLHDRPLGQLSGGQFQRMLFARALVSRPRLLLLDEPTSGIDLHTRAEMLTLVADLNRDGLTVVLTTHDLNWVAAHLPRVVCLNGTVRADGAPEAVLRPDVLRDTFGAEVTVLVHDGRPVVVDSNALVALR